MRPSTYECVPASAQATGACVVTAEMCMICFDKGEWLKPCPRCGKTRGAVTTKQINGERAYLRDCQEWLSDVRRFGWRDQWAESCVLDALDRVWEAQEADRIPANHSFNKRLQLMSLSDTSSQTMPLVPPTAKSVLLENHWKAFYSTEPDFKFRAILKVEFPTPTSVRFTKKALFSELGLGDDVVLTIDSPIVVSNASFNIPASISKVGTNTQGSTASSSLRAGDVGFSMHWGNRVMSMFSRDFWITGQDPDQNQQ